MQVGTKSNLFPLNLVYSYMSGYWIDAYGNIWSTRKKSEPQPMKVNSAGNIQLCLRTHSRSLLLARAKANSLWRTHTEPAVPKTVVKPSASTQTTTKVPVGWVIGTHVGTSFSFSENPKVHVTEGDCIAELERLAKSKPGVTFVSFKVDRSATAGGVIWG